MRGTHGANCTGGCSWKVHVKDGIVGWELQATDYPTLEPSLPPYEPRGFQRGNFLSLVAIYSPLWVKYPYLRGVLTDLWREAKALHSDPVVVWAALLSRTQYSERVTNGLAVRADSAGRGDHCRLDHLYHQKVQNRSPGWFLADYGDVDAQLRR